MLRITGARICQFRIGTFEPLDNNRRAEEGEGAILKLIQDVTSRDSLAPVRRRDSAGARKALSGTSTGTR